MNIEEMKVEIKKLDKLMKPLIDKRDFGNLYGTYNLQKAHLEDQLKGFKQGIEKAEQLITFEMARFYYDNIKDNVDNVVNFSEMRAKERVWLEFEESVMQKLTALNGEAK